MKPKLHKSCIGGSKYEDAQNGVADSHNCVIDRCIYLPLHLPTLHLSSLSLIEHFYMSRVFKFHYLLSHNYQIIVSVLIQKKESRFFCRLYMLTKPVSSMPSILYPCDITLVRVFADISVFHVVFCYFKIKSNIQKL